MLINTASSSAHARSICHAAIESARLGLVAALVDQGAEERFAIGFIEKHFTISATLMTQTPYLRDNGAGHQTRASPDQLLHFARLLQAEYPDAPLGAPITATRATTSDAPTQRRKQVSAFF